jgi:hypothetical protein
MVTYRRTVAQALAHERHGVKLDAVRARVSYTGVLKRGVRLVSRLVRGRRV